MFEVKICSYPEAPKLYDEWGTKMIGLLDTGMPTVSRPHYHIEFFHDIVGDLNGMEPMKPIQLYRIFEFSESFTDEDKVVIHCHAGQSRSTAVAISVLCFRGMDEVSAINYIHSIRDIMWPNDRVIRIADELLSKDGTLVEAVRQWKKENPKKNR